MESAIKRMMDQANINRLAQTLKPDELRAEIIKLHTESHSHYPQYKFQWDKPKWQLCRATEVCEVKSGIAMWKGDFLIADVESTRSYPPLGTFIIIQSMRTGVATSVPFSSIMLMGD